MDGIKNIQLKLSHVSSDSDSYVRGKIVKYCKIGKKKLYISLRGSTHIYSIPVHPASPQPIIKRSYKFTQQFW